MKKKPKYLSIKSHADASFLWMAVKTYGEKLSYECHWGGIVARDRGDLKEAERCHKLYQETQRQMQEFREKLDQVVEKFDREMPGPDDYPDEGGGSGGISHAGMLDGN